MKTDFPGFAVLFHVKRTRKIYIYQTSEGLPFNLHFFRSSVKLLTNFVMETGIIRFYLISAKLLAISLRLLFFFSLFFFLSFLLFYVDNLP